MQALKNAVKALQGARKNKYGAKRVEVDGISFDSTKEGRYYAKLLLAQKANGSPETTPAKIERQVWFRFDVNGVHICKYKLDFRITYADGRIEHVDVKGYKKGSAYRMFVLKKNLMQAIHGITIIEA